MATTGNLFRHKSLSTHLSDCAAWAKRNVDKIDGVEELDKETARLQADAQVVLPVLRRSDADFQISETQDGMTVRVIVPFDGDARLFDISPDSPPRAFVGPYAAVDDARWSGATRQTLTFEQDYDQAQAVEEVKAWAKDQVDSVERILVEMRPQVIAYNNSAAEMIMKFIEARRATLESAAILRSGLGKGI